MLRHLEIENCYSFLNPTSLSTLVNNKAPNSKKYAEGVLDSERLNKVMVILGPNGSGKSNLLRSIIFLKWFLTSSFSEDPDEEFPLRPFLLKESPYAPSKIKVEFSTDSKIYKYSVELTSSTVLNETLDILDVETSSTKERKRFRQLFSRVYDVQDDEYTFKSSPDFDLNEGIKDLVRKRKNASLISAALFTNHSPSLPLKKYWSGTVTMIKQFGERRFPFDIELLRSSEFYYKNEDVKKSMEAIISKSGLGLVGVELTKIEVPDSKNPEKKKNEYYIPYGMHKGLNGGNFKLPFYEESSGTQRIYVLLSKLLPALKVGGVAIVDELEADLHPGMLPSLIDLFLSPKTNPNNAQLLFSCHATPILNSLDKYQIVIVDKDEEGVSEAWRLDDVEGVRSDDNFFAKYSAGAYGGTPDL